MLRSQSTLAIRSARLHIENSLTYAHFKSAADLFELSKSERDPEMAQQLIKQSMEKIAYAHSISEPKSIDRAVCGYRLATMLVRGDTSDPVALRYLDEVELILEEQLLTDTADRPKLILAIQKSLMVKAKWALDLNDGVVLESALEKLFHYFKELPNKEYELDAYRFLFQLHYSQNNFDLAEAAINGAMRISTVDSFVDERHWVKLQLAKLLQTDVLQKDITFITSEITTFMKDVFYPFFDTMYHRYQDQPTFTSSDYMLKHFVKDYMLLFQIYLLYKVPEHALNSVSKDLRLKLNTSLPRDKKIVAQVTSQAKHTLEKMKQGTKYYFGYKLFERVEPYSVPFDLASKITRDELSKTR